MRSKGKDTPGGVPGAGRSSVPHSPGFTLLEVMVAVTILGMVLVTLLGLKNRSLEDVGLAEHITTATLLANGKMMETIMNGNLNPTEDEGEFVNPDQPIQYSWKRTISLIPVAGTSIREIRVAALWMEGNRPEQVELVSYE